MTLICLEQMKNFVLTFLTRKVYDILKVPKRENFSLAFFALNEPIWICDLRTGEKNRIFCQLTPDFDGFWFFAAH
jgi:hypothetical protein